MAEEEFTSPVPADEDEVVEHPVYEDADFSDDVDAGEDPQEDTPEDDEEEVDE